MENTDDLDISIAFEKMSLTPHSSKDFSDHEPIILNAIKGIRTKKKRPDVNSIHDFVMNNGASNVDKTFIQNLIDNLIEKDKILNRKTPQGLDSFYINSNHCPVANIDSPVNLETPKRITSSVIENNLNIPTDTPIIKDNDESSNITSSEESIILENLDTTKSSHQDITEVQQPVFHCSNYVKNEIFDTFYEDYMEFKHYINDVIKSIIPGSELVTNLSNGNTSLQSKIASLENEIESLRKENTNLKDDRKTYLNVIDNLSKLKNINVEDANTYKSKANSNENDESNVNWQFVNSRKNNVRTTYANNANNATSDKNIHFELNNRFSPLNHEEQTSITSILLPKTTKDSADNTKINIMPQNIVKKRPAVVINNFPQNQTVFPKKKVVPGELPFSDAVKSKNNGPTIKIFSDSIAKGIRMREFNANVKSGTARIHCFPGATSTQILHYLDVNLDSSTDTVILHVGINDLLQDMANNNNNITISNIENFMKNIELMVQKCRSFGVKRVFFSGIVITKRISCPSLEEIHEQLVSLCKKLEIVYIDNRNIFGIHLFKDGLHLLESGKQMLAKNFIFNLNNFLCQTQQPIALT